ncbi:flagellar hook protein FlgE [Caulobacter segnis]|uniref:Flagellar hook protein FlgE n=2 Tax=Caulobacter segnis TaxID=88688 RepID=D5VEB6_CAUST|nr:flagellar hook protein FlgE [Caulobacter segnis]ADG08939.1 fagellar hook-basal body protein [Caulobacter segnis ATCC 21756]AVQ00774.1 flagellar hook protein FlgE [Caulobacter segnis]
MSLSAALSTAVSGLTAQSRALSAISENIANSSTTAYKTTDVYFQALVSGGKGSSTSTSAVTAKSSQAMSVQGTVTSTSVATNVAIQDAGFFVVTSDPAGAASEDMYTRNGSFETNADGYLINTEGFYLMGWPTDAEGNVLASNTNDLTGLSAINLSSIGGTAKATTEIEMSANVPADAAVGAALTTSMQMIDSLGVSHTVGQTWTKTADNTWELTLSDPVLTSDGTTQSGTINGGPYTVVFNTDGSLGSVTPALDFTVTGFSSGAADSAVSLDIGEVGGTDGVTQYASTSSTIGLEDVQTEQDGALYGELSGISIDSDGLVTANFDNGISLAIYQIPIATFSNPNGLTLVSGTTYDENSAAGQVHLNLPGEGGAGSLVASALEGSTTDIATEFNKMIIAQQAYSAASQVVSSASDMFDSLIQAVR